MAKPATPQSNSRVFISYRRADSAGHAGRLRDGLISRFGKEDVFIDVDSIRPGSDYVAALDTALDHHTVVLALIGPRWLTADDQRGRRRLDVPSDMVRQELETALRRGAAIIPVLLGSATMPTAGTLPSSLGAIARLQAVRLRDDRWRSDVQALISAIGRIRGAEGAAQQRRAGATPSQAERQRLELTGKQIDAQLEYNLAALQTRGAAVQDVLGLTRHELTASDRHAKDRQRSMDDTRRKLTSANPTVQESLLRIYARDDVALADHLASRGDTLSHQVDVILNGAGALAVAPQPFPELPHTGARKPADKPRSAVDPSSTRNRRRRATDR